MISKAVVVGRNVRQTKKEKTVVTYCLQLSYAPDSYEGDNVYRYDVFEPSKVYEVGEMVTVCTDRYESVVTDIAPEV